MRTRPMTGKAALVVLVLACAATACVESPGKYDSAGKTASATSVAHTKSTPAPGPDTVSIKVLEEAITKTKSVTTGHFSTVTDAEFALGAGLGFSCTSGEKSCVPETSSEPTTTVADDWMQKHHPPVTPGKTATGAFDRTHDRASLDIEFLVMDSVVMDGEHAYVHMTKGPPKSAPWVEMSTDELKKTTKLLLGSVNPTDPMDVLQDVKFVEPTATVVGSDRLEGTPVVHYKTFMNLSAFNAARRAPDLSSSFTDEKIESPGADAVPVELWIDKSGLVRRIWYAASFDSSMTYRQKSQPDAPLQTSTSHNDIAFDLSLTHPDEPVKITVPKPSQVSPLPPGGFKLDATGP